MPWKETNVMELRKEFIKDMLTNEIPFKRLCQEYGISEKTGHKWKNRFMEYGYDGLRDLSKAAKNASSILDEDVIIQIIKLRQTHKFWGAAKIRELLKKNFSDRQIPSISTINRILKKAGLIKPKKKRNVYPDSANSLRNLIPANGPNDVWAIDFKGWWVSSGEVCEPFNVIDLYSRKILCSKLVESKSTDAIKEIFIDLFRRYGLPKVIRSDNGIPFASRSRALGLTKLSAWWVSLGIMPDRTKKGSPYQNGVIERMHKDMAEQIENKYAGGIEFNQMVIDDWVYEYNNIRPHEALGMKTPNEFYKSSDRKYIENEELVYPLGFEVRKVSSSGTIKYFNNLILISTALSGLNIGIKPSAKGKCNIFLADLYIGELDTQLSCFNSLE